MMVKGNLRSEETYVEIYQASILLDRVEMDHCADLHYGLNLRPQVYRILSETQKSSKYLYHLIINSY